ncbi:Protein archease-like [Durusdinium trenchii]|uniref:Protein archease-like n=1 Tax=Durusdinium trenchii TaxID=1381693 RepID=A0ABP0RD86_9DINO
MRERCELLNAAVLRLERSSRSVEVLSSNEAHTLTEDLCDLAKRWPEEEQEEDDASYEAEAPIFLRLEEVLVKLPSEAQEKIVAAFRPLRAEVSRRLAEWTNEINDWLSDAGSPNSSNTLQTTSELLELLREIEASPQLRWYRQCRKSRVKAKFLMAVASFVRAVLQKSPLVKSWLDQIPDLTSLVRKIEKQLFVLPGLGNILETWHEGRLQCYNATLSLAAQRAADKMRDDLQVSLVSAVKRSTTAPSDDGKAKVALQIQLREWPMSGCPLARALLEFLKSHALELGDLGRPSLRECPPHSLQPTTLQKLLSRLDAFDLGGPPGLVRLRFEAVAALAYKAVGTKPKAGAAVPPKSLNTGSPTGTPSPTNVPLPTEISIDYNDVSSMSRLIRRGLHADDEEWRQAWEQFCYDDEGSDDGSINGDEQSIGYDGHAEPHDDPAHDGCQLDTLDFHHDTCEEFKEHLQLQLKRILTKLLEREFARQRMLKGADGASWCREGSAAVRQKGISIWG